MKFIASLFFLIIIIKPLWAQSYSDVMDSSKITIHTDNNHKLVFHIKEIHKKPSPEKTYFWYQSREIHETQGNYSGKLLHGDYTNHYPTNNLAHKGQFRNGLKTGIWTAWYENGTRKNESGWKKGEETGAYSLFDEKGNTTETGNLQAGKRNGKITLWVSQDSTFSTSYYQDGKEISKEQYFDQNIFRKTGHYLRQQWQKLFSKKNG